MLRATVERFVDLVKANPQLENLDESQVQLLTSVLRAGWWGHTETVYRLVPGKLRGSYRDQDGSSTGETYLINARCPYKVIFNEGERERDGYGPTRWLDDVVGKVTGRGWGQDPTRDQIVDELVEMIEASIPMEPIQLTPDGDKLKEYPPDSGGLHAKHTRDDNKLGCCVGVHAYCGSWVDRRGATETHDALVCRGCYIRVLFPKTVQTYGELRELMENRLRRLKDAR